MAKRFTDTELWDKDWFMKLKPRLKCLTKFIFDKCDVAGVWSPNWILASAYIGEPVKESDLKEIDSQIEKLPDGRFFIPGFISFQYGVLSENCRPHLKIISLLKKYGLYDKVLKGYVKGIDTLQEKEEDKEEETEMEKEEGVQGKPKKEVVQIELVYPYDSQRFIETWKVLRNEKKWKNKSPAALQSSLNQLSEFDEGYAVDLMMKAISGNYQGVVFSNTKSEYEKQKNGNSTDKKTRFIGGRVTQEAAAELLAAARLHHARKENAHGNTG